MVNPRHSFLCALALAMMPPPASAQLRVDARIQMSSGSCAGCDLSNKAMNGVHLKNANMSGSSFNNSNLSGGRLDGSDLSGAHFRSALMYRVKGKGVKMRKAILEDATLTEASLPDAKFAEANLSRANLSRATFTNTDFTSARFDNANLSGAQFQDGQFHQASFDGAILSDAALDRADFSGADLSRSQGLQQAQLDTACGDMRTRLPIGLSLPYCDDATTSTADHAHDGLSPELEITVTRIDRAITDVENLLAATNPSDRALRTRLQRIHSDLVQSKAALEQ